MGQKDQNIAGAAPAADTGVDPLGAATAEDFVRLLALVRRQSGLSLRAIERRARTAGEVLPASTLATMLGRGTLPRREMVITLLTACGVTVDRLAVWLAQWRTLAGEEVTAPLPAPGPVSDASVRRAADPGPPLAAVRVPRQLPASPDYFVGRRRELTRLTDVMARHGTMAIAAVTGAGGLGKTWLALRWAHENLARYQDGQMYLNLRGFDPADRPVAPEEALPTLLEMLGVARAAMPVGLSAQIGLYRSLLSGRRMLVILDNAHDAAQVEPLLPGSAGCAVIITSRRQLTSLAAAYGAELLTLDPLPAADAHDLLALRLGEGRLRREPGAAADIVDRCDRLPLALALVAARAAGKPQWTLATFADELGHSDQRLDMLTSDAALANVRLAFSCSYRALRSDAARLFRLLGLHPGPDISTAAAASLAGVSVRRARELMAELVDANLVAEPVPGRYGLHDLLRLYATEQVHVHETEEQRRAGLNRVLDHYLHTAVAANHLITSRWRPIAVGPPAMGVIPEQLADGPTALAWIAGELRVLVAGVQLAADGFEAHAWRLADALGAFFSRQGHWHDWHTVAQAAASSARRARDLTAQAHAECRLAELHAWIGHHGDTASHLDRADRLYAQLGDVAGQAYVHLCRGWIYEPRHEYVAALDHAEQALRLYTSAVHPQGQANALNNVGWYNAQLGNFQNAISQCRRALAQHQQLGNRNWEGRAWDSLGYAHHGLGLHDRASTCYQHAIAIFRELGSRYFEARALTRLGDTYHESGHPESARRAWLCARDILHDLQHPTVGHVGIELDH